MNVFRKHREKEQAKQAAASAARSGGEDMAGASTIYEHMMVQLEAHKAELKAVKSLKLKAVKKAEFIPIYTAYVDGILAANENVQDDVVMTIFVWALDARDFELALRIAEWALEHDISPPPNFERSVAAILAEEVAENALSDLDKLPEYFDVLESVLELVVDADMPDQVKAKLYKAFGFAHTDEDPNFAHNLLKQALDFNPKIGVKRQIEALERRIKKPAPVKKPAPDQKAPPAAVPAKDTETKASESKSGAATDADADAKTGNKTTIVTDERP